MKLKRLFSVIGLGLFAAVSAGAGVALNSKVKAEPVKADGEKWMVTICFDNTIPETSGEWGYVDNQKVNFWGTNVTYEASEQSFHPTGRDHFYAVNVVFTSEQSVTGFQINFKEDGVKKQSQDINIALDSGCNGRVYTFSFPEDVSWPDGKWTYYRFAGFDEPSGHFGGVSKNFTPDPETASYVLKDVVVDTSSSYYINLDPFCYSAHANDDTYYVVRTDADYWENYFYHWYGENWIEIREDQAGTYDFFITNEYKDGGVLDVRKQEPVNNTYIYYVLENDNFSTDDYIYSWGGSQQFGAWTGTQIKSVTDVEKHFDNSVLKFEGGAKTIYKIPVKIGYPAGDSSFKWNNGVTGEGAWESDEGTLVAGAAYWYTASADADAGKAIDFLIAAEEKRNAAGSYSVCNISKSDATALVNSYNALTDDQRAYVDSSKVYTWTDSSKSAEADISYRNVVIQLGKIAEVHVEGSPMTIVGNVGTNAKIDTTTMIAVISIIALVSVSSIVVLVVIKKRKHN